MLSNNRMESYIRLVDTEWIDKELGRREKF